MKGNTLEREKDRREFFVHRQEALIGQLSEGRGIMFSVFTIFVAIWAIVAQLNDKLIVNVFPTTTNPTVTMASTPANATVTIVLGLFIIISIACLAYKWLFANRYLRRQLNNIDNVVEQSFRLTYPTREYVTWDGTINCPCGNKVESMTRR